MTKTWLIDVSRHHNNDPGYRFLTTVEDFRAALTDAVVSVLENETSCDDVSAHKSLIVIAVDQIVAPATVQAKRLVPLCIPGDEFNDEPDLFLLWHDSPDPTGPADKANIGIGPGYRGRDGLTLTNKQENYWFAISEWVPDPARVAELKKLTKDAIIDLLLRQEAVR